MYYLVGHPEALEIVRQEILEVLKLSGVEHSSDKDVKLSREQLEKLLHLGMSVFSETSMQILTASTPFRHMHAQIFCVSKRLGESDRTDRLLGPDLCPQRAPSMRASACPRPP